MEEDIALDKRRSANITVEDNRIIRFMPDMNEAKKILALMDKNNMFKEHIVNTAILSEENKTVFHEKIKHIIHSGEYTSSMAYDVTSLALNMAVIAEKAGLYAFDLHPHNFTFSNGKWILYDFGSFSLSPKQVKTQIRSTFKIAFASYELLKIVSREKLKHYFLNRIKCRELFRMLPFKSWFFWWLKMRFTQVLCLFKQYNKVYCALVKFQNLYKIKRNSYKISLSDNEKLFFKIIDNEFLSDCSDVFCLGKLGADWGVTSNSDIEKVIYLDDYELCDNLYNYIVQNNLKNISTAVLQPLTADSELPDNLKFRALYDNFTKTRMVADAVLFDFDEVFDEVNCDIDKFCKTISDYVKKSLIIKINCPRNFRDKAEGMSESFEWRFRQHSAEQTIDNCLREVSGLTRGMSCNVATPAYAKRGKQVAENCFFNKNKYSEILKEKLSLMFKETYIKQFENCKIVCFKERLKPLNNEIIIYWGNENRMRDAELHSKEIFKIISK